MMTPVQTLGFIVAFLLVQAGVGVVSAADVSGTPEVIDGDTLAFIGTTVRLAGIDAPELGQRCTIGARTYDCGAVARTALLDLVAGSLVMCQTLGQTANGGATAAEAARCTAGGYDLSEGMVYTGWALSLPETDNRYRPFETGARQNRRGVWKGDFIAPWEWRKGARLPQEAAH